MYKKETKEVAQCKINSVLEAYEFMERFASDEKWIAGETLTIADFSLILP